MPKASKLAKVIEERDLVYPKYGAVIYCVDEADVQDGFPYAGGAVDDAVARELFGWTTDAEEAASLDLGEPLGRDPFGNPFWGKNNVKNRPIYLKGEKSVDSVLQEIFNLRWHYNSEPIILGKHGIVLNGQHQLVAVIFANILWNMESGMDWRRNWPDLPPYIEKLVTYGVEETDEVVNTMDTCRARSLSDVIFRCEFFGRKGRSDNKTLSRILDSAVRFCWSRTGSGMSAFATHRTQSESIDWIERHRKILKAVSLIYKQYKNSNGAGWVTNNKRLGAGYAAGLALLMAVSRTGDDVVEQYRDKAREGAANDRKLDYSLAEKVEEFWTLFASGSEAMKNVYEEIGKFMDPATGSGGSSSVKLCIIINAWRRFLEDKPITGAAVRPELAWNPTKGMNEQTSYPKAGGIDLGDPNDPGNRKQEDDPDEQELRDRARQIKEDNEQKEREGAEAAKAKKKKEGKGEGKKGGKKAPEPQPADEVDELNMGWPEYRDEEPVEEDLGESEGGGHSGATTPFHAKKAGTKDRRGHTVPKINFHDADEEDE